MKHEHLFIGGPWDGDRFTVLYGDDAVMFSVVGERHMYRRMRLAETNSLHLQYDVFVYMGGEPINVIEALIKNYRKEEK